MSKTDDYIFELDSESLEKLRLLQFDSSFSVADIPLQTTPAENVSTETGNADICLACNYTFAPKLPQHEKSQHYKSDLHRLNLKRSLNALPPLGEQEFEEILESQSLESISGSDDSDSESDSEERLPTLIEKLSLNENNGNEEDELPVSHMNTRSPFVLFESPSLDASKAVGVYKAMFPENVLASGKIHEALKQYNSAPSRSGHSVLFMIGGGHFAGAVISHSRLNIKGNAKNSKESLAVQKVSVVESKTFHRYTTRRKQGGSQSASDNAHGKANSAGSSIRRYNEQALIKEVRELLSSWKRYLDGAEHIFIRANGIANRKILVGYEGSPLASSDSRIRSFPFTTKRATLSEVKNAWANLTYLVNLDRPAPIKTTKAVTPETKQKPAARPETPVSDQQSQDLVSAMKRSKVPLLINYMRKNQLDVQFELTPSEQYANTPTLLHYASAQGLSHMVRVLLINLKADPVRVNSSGKTAAQIRQNDQIMDVFQICRSELGEDFCDWDAAKVGPAKSSEEIAEKEARKKNAAQSETRRLIAEELAKKSAEDAKSTAEKRESRFSPGVVLGGNVLTNVSETSGLTDQQKMRLMREQRARAAEARMKR